MTIYNPAITVCSECYRACCFQGEFMCDLSDCADVVDVSVFDLLLEQGFEYHEHPDYWNNHLRMGNERLLAVNDLKALGIADPNYLELA